MASKGMCTTLVSLLFFHWQNYYARPIAYMSNAMGVQTGTLDIEKVA